MDFVLCKCNSLADLWLEGYVKAHSVLEKAALAVNLRSALLQEIYKSFLGFSSHTGMAWLPALGAQSRITGSTEQILTASFQVLLPSKVSLMSIISFPFLFLFFCSFKLSNWDRQCFPSPWRRACPGLSFVARRIDTINVKSFLYYTNAVATAVDCCCCYDDDDNDDDGSFAWIN